MGVHQLWNILEPSSRPVRLESLSRRKMAVDASIWIYQFLKAVRSEQGRSLHASHVVGFFRRICKLLYFGIQPVFVFDGGAPQLKKEVIRKRKERRQGKRENAENTAQKLLALQLQRKNEESQGSPQKRSKNAEDAGDVEYRYLEEFDGSAPKKIEDNVPKRFRGEDEYELPSIAGFAHDKKDERLTAADEYQDVTEKIQDELDGIDLNTIDPASAEFDTLPLTTQYMVLSQLRLRSRLRMGYSKEQLEDIFPEKMKFSRFQIEMVQKRNYFTQRLMNISGMAGADEPQETRRIASEKDRAYKIQKTEGGWALSLEDDSGMTAANPVDVDREMRRERGEDVSENDDEDFEWEDVDLSPKIKKKINQSISAGPLPPAPEVSESGSAIKAFTFSPSKSRVRKTEKYDDDGFEEDQDRDLRHMEELELMEAIKKSKEDLKKQQRLEEEVIKKKIDQSKEEFAKMPLQEDYDGDADFEDIPFDFGDEGKSSVAPKAAAFSAIINSKPPTLSFPKPNPPIPDAAKSKSDVNSRTEMDHMFMLNPSRSGILQSPGGKQRESLGQNPAVPGADDAEYPSVVPAVPSWFQKSFVNPYELRKEGEAEKKTDEKIGLVSWSEAQEIMNNEEAHESDDPQILEFRKEEIINLVSDDEQQEESDALSKEVTSEQPPKSSVSSETPNEPTKVDNSAPPLDYEFYESEEEQINEQLEREELEHDEFQKELNPRVINTAFIDTERTLRKQQKKELRDADEVTATMVREVQDLLARFGIPYITAPMEAEAQCSELLQLGLVDGIITDDSDVFLFGGDRVYRNMFHEKHYVEFYSGKELEKQGLSRKKMIELAHLLGSDYTEGLKSVGPVNAMEILANFGDLSKFREWFVEGQFDLDKQKAENTWERTLRKKLVKNDVHIDKSFPDKRIDQAYLAAEVDHDPTDFVWGSPDLDRLRNFLMATVGWSQERVDQVLVPLIRDLNKKKREGTQATLGEFYDVEAVAGVKRKLSNKRMSAARAKMRKSK